MMIMRIMMIMELSMMIKGDDIGNINVNSDDDDDVVEDYDDDEVVNSLKLVR